jgi:branched-chain amino acid transport system substrate-binding protein
MRTAWLGGHVNKLRTRLRRANMFTALAAGVVLTAAGCGSASPSAAPAPAPAKSAAYPAPKAGNGGATATGVTATAINAALVYSITGPSPGATAGELRGTKAYIDYINSIGGVYGRKLSVTPYDDGFDPTKAAADCAQIIPKSFAIIGGFATADAGCYPAVKSSGIPWAQYAFDPQFEPLPNVYYMGAGPATQLPDASYIELRHLFPQVKKVAVLWETTPGNSQAMAHIAVGLGQVGFKVVYQQGVNVTLPSFTSYATAVANSGAQAVFYDAGSEPGQSRMAQAFAQESYKPAFIEAATTYASSWHSLAGAAASGWVEPLPYLPFLDSQALAATPGGKLFDTWFAAANPGQAVDLFAVFGWVNTALFVQGLIKAGPHLTRTGLLAAIHNLKSFDAGGLYAPQDIGQKAFSNCTLIMESTASGYTQLAPKQAGTFDCNVPGAKILDTPGVPS